MAHLQSNQSNKMIVTSELQKTVSYFELEVGDIFELENEYYMKIFGSGIKRKNIRRIDVLHLVTGEVMQVDAKTHLVRPVETITLSRRVE